MQLYKIDYFDIFKDMGLIMDGRRETSKKVLPSSDRAQNVTMIKVFYFSNISKNKKDVFGF